MNIYNMLPKLENHKNDIIIRYEELSFKGIILLILLLPMIILYLFLLYCQNFGIALFVYFGMLYNYFITKHCSKDWDFIKSAYKVKDIELKKPESKWDN